MARILGRKDHRREVVDRVTSGDDKVKVRWQPTVEEKLRKGVSLGRRQGKDGGTEKL
jgi:hypothetical protein